MKSEDQKHSSLHFVICYGAPTPKKRLHEVMLGISKKKITRCSLTLTGHWVPWIGVKELTSQNLNLKTRFHHSLISLIKMCQGFITDHVEKSWQLLQNNKDSDGAQI